jgi:hypothetical protein
LVQFEKERFEMKALNAALFLILLSAAPTLALPSIDLPHLTWPDESTEPVTQACLDQARPGAPAPCTQ